VRSTGVKKRVITEIFIYVDGGLGPCLHIDEDGGISGFSGELLAVLGTGERVSIDTLGFLQAVYEEGIRVGAMRARDKK
jgi:hypothetical protein